MADYFQIPLCITKLWVGHKQVSLKSMHKVYKRTVTLTFDLVTWFLFVTHFLVMMIICHDDHLCPIIFKSHNAQQSYGSDMNRFH